MMLTGLLLLGAASGLDARVVKIDLIRTTGVDATWYNKVEVELASGAAQSVRLCPGDASVTTARRTNDGFAKVARYRAHALRLPGGKQTGGCQDVSLVPGQAQRVSFLIREVPGRWRGEDRYIFDLAAGQKLFRFMQAGQRTPG